MGDSLILLGLAPRHPGDKARGIPPAWQRGRATQLFSCSHRYKAPEKGKTQSGSAPAERFAFHGWYAAGKGVSGQKPNTKKRRRLHLTEVTIQPNDHYCFEIWAGNQPVISFFFQKLPEA